MKWRLREDFRSLFTAAIANAPWERVNACVSIQSDVTFSRIISNKFVTLKFCRALNDMNNRWRFSEILIACSFLSYGELLVVGGEVAKPAPKCAAGCSAAVPPKSELSATEIARCLERIARQPVGEASLELETLLFHANRVIPYLQTFGTEPLKAEQSRFLKRELARSHAHIRLRVVDSEGKERMTFDREVPIGVKQHLHSEAAVGFVPPEVGFTVQRVGLRHLWTRL